MNEFFEKLKRENWGFPWHIILSLAGTVSAIILLRRIFPGISLSLGLIVTFLAINLIGVLHEIMQNKRGQDNRRGSLQDIIANNAGIVLGIGLFLLSVNF